MNSRELVAQQLVGLGDVELREALRRVHLANLSLSDVSSLRKWCEERAEDGEPGQILVYAKLLAAGLLGPPDRDKAIRLLETRSPPDHLPSQYTLASLKYQASAKEARDQLEKLADLRYPSAMRSVAFSRMETAEDQAAATRLLKLASDALDPMALHWEAIQLINRGDPSSVETAIQKLKMAAERDLAGACTDLALIYAYSKYGVEKDDDLANLYFDKARSLGANV